jgi:hypothetical protein
MPVQGSPTVRQLPRNAQALSSHAPLQQSASSVQISPEGRQAAELAQRNRPSPRSVQNPEQQLPSLEHISPRGSQEDEAATHRSVPPVSQSFEQQPASSVQISPVMAQVAVPSQVPATQPSEQQSAATVQDSSSPAQPVPDWHRDTPARSASHRPEQHSPLDTHSSPTP